MTTLRWFKDAFEYLGGSRDESPRGMTAGLRSPWWGLWWGLLAAVIALFCGQGSKFIYIDF